MSTPQADGQQPDPQVMVRPVYLAGSGDTAAIYDPLSDTRGWGKAITEGGLMFTSPRLDTQVAYLPESRFGGWRITRYQEPLGTPIWSAAFSRYTPAEITAAFTHALADNVHEEHRQVRRPADVLAERGWRNDDSQLHPYQWSPDGHAYLSQRSFEVDEKAELQGDFPTRWTMYARAEKARSDPWHATFTERTPLHLVTAAVRAFSSPDRVEREHSDIPERNLPYVTVTPVTLDTSDRRLSAALARTSHTHPVTAGRPTGVTASERTSPTQIRRR